MFRYFIFTPLLFAVLSSCEEVINVDLNSAKPAFVVEAVIFKDSLCHVRLTKTTSYFSHEEPGVIEDAKILISDGTNKEQLTYKGNGYYVGDTIIGTVEKTYEIEIQHDGTIYKGSSYMPDKTDFISVQHYKTNTTSIFNPDGETVFSIRCEFKDHKPDSDNFYLIRFLDDNSKLGDYYLLTEKNTNSGSLTNTNDTIVFSESLFYDGGNVEVQLFSIDESLYNYFRQLDDILFWKRRVMPPTPYNPVSNISNGALGYFAAWTLDSESITLE
jgi:hypothetical protein